VCFKWLTGAIGEFYLKEADFFKCV
jgi:hypothetical protein